VGFALAGALVERNFALSGDSVHGYAAVFYVSGLLGIVWFPFFIWRVSELVS
jgi:hypothetical protein